MYTAHYNLKIKPFQISSDSYFMWLGENHKEALATLRYGILDNKGFLLLTGDVGTGKTTLINALISTLSKDVIYASVPDPSLDKMDFFNYIASAFGLGSEFASKGKFLSSFTRFLHKTYENNQKVLLIIDESQLMTQELLEEVRLLSNIVTKDSNPLLNIFFVGQYEFNELIRRPENRAIAQRLTLNYYIEPLTLEETGEYIRHRLRIAGTTEKIFNTSAIKEIYAFSNGFPRKINIICDHCLMSGYAEEKKIITSAIVKDSAGELQIPEHRRGQEEEGQTTAQQKGTPKAVAAEPPGRTLKISLSWPIIALLLLIVLLMSGSYYFLYYTNERFKEATAHFSAIQEKIVLNTAESSGNNRQQVSRGKDASQKNTPETKALPAAGAPLPAETTKVTADSAQKTEPVIVATAMPVKSDAQSVLPVSAVLPERIKAQPVLLAGTLPKEPGQKDLPPESLALPDETLVIRFKYDSNLFSVVDIERMKEFARILKVHPEATINISGYTDSTGDEGYNKKLSEFRANMVKSFLMGQDLSPEQMKAQGFGNQNPVDGNDTEQGRMMNRRVEISVVKNEG